MNKIRFLRDIFFCFIFIPPSQNTPGLPRDKCEGRLRRDVTGWTSPVMRLGGITPRSMVKLSKRISPYLTPRNFKEISGTTVLEIAKRFLRASRGSYRYLGLAWGVSILVVSLSFSGYLWADCRCTFNWYCAGCSHIGARTTDTEGPFGSREACESAAQSMHGYYGDAGGVDVMPCDCNDCDASPSSSSAASGYSGQQTSGSSYSAAPQYDYAQRQRQEEAARLRREEEKKRIKEEREALFQKTKKEALALIKGSGSGELEIKSGTDTPFFNIKGNPDTGLKLKSGNEGDQTQQESHARFSCAASLTENAIPAARSGDIAEAHFLGQQVDKVIKGESPEAECRYDMLLPDVKGSPVKPDTPIGRFYYDLINFISVQATKIKAQRDVIKKAGFNPDEGNAALEKKIKKLLSEQPKDKKEAVSETGEPPKKKDRKALEAALAALREAQKEEDKVNKCLSYHEALKQDPGQADNLSKEIEQLSKK